MKKYFSLALIVAAAAALTSACAGLRSSSRSHAQTSGSAAPAKPANPGLTEAGRTVDAEPQVRGDDMRAVAQLKTVLFAYASDRLDAQARRTLRANARWLKAHPGANIQVAGHCDQRGTVAYNLALGQRRADAVRRYYKAMGIAASRLATISYGKERPLCSEMEEACWSRNRRAQTLEAVEAKVAAP